MTTCPNCGRELTGQPRSCGYCGQSLVQDYFLRKEPTASIDDRLHPAGIAAAALGISGGVALLAALAFHMLALFGIGDPDFAPEINAVWWVRTLLMTVLPVAMLVQQFILRGRRYTLVSDCVWLFLSACALVIVVQAYLDTQADFFYGVAWIPYLLVVGCALVLCSAVAGIFACRGDA